MSKAILGIVGLFVASLVGATVVSAQAPDPADVEKGRKLFKFNCYVCHVKNDPYEDARVLHSDAVLAGDPLLSGDAQFQFVQNVWGPDLKGVFGAPAGRRAAEGFRYSEIFLEATAGLVWTEENLDKWLIDTNAMVPGTWMRFKVPDAEKRRLIIAFLKVYE